MPNPVQIKAVSAREAQPAQNLAPAEMPRFDLRTLYGNVLKMTETETDRGEFLMKLLQQTISVTNAVGGIYFIQHPEKGLMLGPRLLSKQSIAAAPHLVETISDRAKHVADTGRLETLNDEYVPDQVTVLAPVSFDHQSNEVLAVSLHLPGARVEPFVAIVQLIAGYVNFWGIRAVARVHRREADISAALVELVARLHGEADISGAYFTLVNELKAITGADRVALGLRRGLDGRCRLETISGLSDFDGRTELVDTLEAVFSDACASDQATSWPPISVEPETQRDGLLANRLRCHERLLSVSGANQVAASPLSNADGEPIGALALWWNNEATDENLEDYRHVVQLLDAVALPLGACISRLKRTRGAVTKQGSGRVKKMVIFAIAASLFASLFIPMQHRVTADAVVEPVVSRQVAAPFDGLVLEGMVKAGDVIEKGMLLARLDGRELKWQLESLRSEYARVGKRRDISMAEGDTSGAQIARLEMNRVSNQIKLLKHQIANLEIQSPIAGMVVTGDLSRFAGSPVRRGQALFEVAPLDTMIAEVHIPADDVAYVDSAAPVSMSLESYPGELWEQPLGTIQPRSEVIDGENVFVAEIQLDNAGGRLKPGMRGVVHIDASERTIGWVLFHKAGERIAATLGIGGIDFQNGRFGFDLPSEYFDDLKTWLASLSARISR